MTDNDNIVVDLKNAIERDLFYWEQDADGNMVVTGDPVSIPYDTLNLVGINGPGYICSALVVELYKHADHPLFELHDSDFQRQYSPHDLRERLKLLGDVD